VQVNEDREDPSGEGRKRLVEQKSIFGFFVEGTVEWVDSSEETKRRRERSQVKLTTANGNNELVLS